MATCVASELVESGKCFAGFDQKQFNMVTLALLCQILQNNNPMASCSASDLLNDAKCFDCLTPKQMLMVQTQLLCEILSGGGTGETCLVCGVGAPTEAAPCDCSIYYSLPPNAGVWVWDSVTAAWECILNMGV